MNCRTIERYLSAYLDGEMDSARRDAFFDHLTECEACRDRVGEASYAEAALAGALKRRMTAPASIRYNVLSAISRESARRAPVRRGLAWRPAAAMAAVLALGTAGWRTFTTSLQPAAPAADSQAAPKRVAALPPSAVRTPPPEIAAASRRETPRVVAPRPAAPRPVTVAAHPAPPKKAPVPASPKPERAATPAAAAPKTSAVTHAPENPVGQVTSITGNPVLARFMARREGKQAWQDATRNVHANTHLQSGDDTIVTMTLNDGTTLKSNQHTEFVVLRSPGKDDPSWGIRLIRGELWIKSQGVVDVTTPSMDVHAESAEFSVRSMDGEDAAVMAVDGKVTARNARGAAGISAGQATAAAAGAAPEEPFDMANPKGQMDWAYAPPAAPAK